MLNRLDLRGAGGALRDRLPRPAAAASAPAAVDAVRGILADVAARGDVAVREYGERFDGVRLDEARVAPDELDRALRSCEPRLVAALTAARDAVQAFHESQRRADHVYERDGVAVECRTVPVDRAGIYVPGGRGAYPSTVLMTAVPARVAGVGAVVLCVPPDRRTGAVAPVVLAAAALAGVDEVHAIGGAQAVGAMAYGTETLRPVDVIAGPGNIYVALAKREVSGVVGVPSAFTGPSEIVVVADATTPAEFAAIDVVVQAEHGPDGLAWLVTWDADVLDEVDAAIERIVEASPRRDEIESTFAGGGYAVLVDGPDDAVEVANLIAPEHLQLMCDGAAALAGRVRHAGAVFCGPWSPASVGDYLAGPSHVLPTHGSARFGSALTVDDFCKQVHVVTLDRAALARVAPDVEVLATAEGFHAHADSVRVRVEHARGDEVSS